jgi:hypothetical protein
VLEQYTLQIFLSVSKTKKKIKKGFIMSMMRALDLSSVTLNGHTFSGWSGDEDALTLPDSSELAMFVKGADGKIIAGRTGERGGEVSIKLLANSPSVQFMQTAVLALKNGASIQWEGLIKYNDNSLATLIKGILIKAPLGLTLGKGVAKTMTYVFEFELIDYETITGDFS